MGSKDWIDVLTIVGLVYLLFMHFYLYDEIEQSKTKINSLFTRVNDLENKLEDKSDKRKNYQEWE